MESMEINNLKTQKEGCKPLKIYKKYFRRFGYYNIFPEIRLSGKWLQNLGFNCGQKVIIIHEKNRIVIRNSKKIIVKL
jgi:toxic protein SymE